jgi:Flp pilus assembly protein TadG
MFQTTYQSKRLRRVHRDQRGAGYTLSYVLTMPFYLLLVCMIVETPLVLMAKLGTVRAANAAARSAAVYASTEDWSDVEERALRAAKQSMTPLASGVQGPLHLAGGSDGLFEYVGAYTVRNAGLEGSKYVAGKYSYAQNAVKVSLGGPPPDWNAPIAATTRCRSRSRLNAHGRGSVR